MFKILLVFAGMGVMALNGCHGISSGDGKASFAQFDLKAANGEELSVVFFGGSLTWGANASDPQTTSYRALMCQHLRKKYPEARFTFHDAAIGGTGSSLGMFRLERDVLSRKPDLVFLDFTANDGLDGEDRPTLACYETLLREMTGRGIPVVQAFFGFKWQFGKNYAPEKVPRRRDHLKLADAYGTARGDLYPLMQEAVISGGEKVENLWPFDGAHPDDPGYRIFFEAVKNGFEEAVKEGSTCKLPEKPVFGHYKTVKRIRLADTILPEGWKRSKTFRTSNWFDGLSSRWMDDVAMCDIKGGRDIKPIRLEFEGSLVGLFGEADAEGLDLKVRIDGKDIPQITRKRAETIESETWNFNTKRFKEGGRLFIWRLIRDDLPPGRHALEIIPVIPEGAAAGQLRIESVCAAEE